MLNQPTSSPMMTRMFGFLPPAAGCFAVASSAWTSRVSVGARAERVAVGPAAPC